MRDERRRSQSARGGQRAGHEVRRRWVPQVGPELTREATGPTGLADRATLRSISRSAAIADAPVLLVMSHNYAACCDLRAAEHAPRLVLAFRWRGWRAPRARTPIRRYLKSFSSVYDVARHAFELRRGRVILSGVHDAPEAVSPT
jgi:hypothetical protein